MPGSSIGQSATVATATSPVWYQDDVAATVVPACTRLGAQADAPHRRRRPWTSSLASHHHPWCCTPHRLRRARLPVTTTPGAVPQIVLDELACQSPLTLVLLWLSSACREAEQLRISTKIEAPSTVEPPARMTDTSTPHMGVPMIRRRCSDNVNQANVGTGTARSPIAA